jgi:hypothetical protein
VTLPANLDDAAIWKWLSPESRGPLFNEDTDTHKKIW